MRPTQGCRFCQELLDQYLKEDMDGYGDQSGKLQNYDTFVRQSGAKYGGIKLFYTHDVGLLSEQQIENLVPQPNVIIYQ